MNETLYDYLGMKVKNSVFKSVFIHKERNTFYRNSLQISIEPYDDTFLRATETVKKYNDTIDRIENKVKKVFASDYENDGIVLNIYTAICTAQVYMQKDYDDIVALQHLENLGRGL